MQPCHPVTQGTAKSGLRRAFESLLHDSLANRSALVNYVEVSWPLTTDETLTVVVSGRQSSYDVVFTALALGHCLHYGGARGTGWGLFAQARAVERWNDALRGAELTAPVMTPDDARDLGLLYITFATGLLPRVEQHASRLTIHPDDLGPLTDPVVATAVYRSEDQWEVTGVLWVGRQYTFALRLLPSGSIVDMWLSPA